MKISVSKSIKLTALCLLIQYCCKKLNWKDDYHGSGLLSKLNEKRLNTYKNQLSTYCTHNLTEKLLL